MLSGERDALAQSASLPEKPGFLAITLFKPLIAANYQTITATQLAHALIKVVEGTAQETRNLLSGETQHNR